MTHIMPVANDDWLPNLLYPYPDTNKHVPPVVIKASEVKWGLGDFMQEQINVLPDTPMKVSPDGGPSKYYDLPKSAVTLNDLIEIKSVEQWKEDSFHLSNVFKACWRWGNKEGTTKAYDARKMIYSGARLLMRLAGVVELRKTLQQMLDDPQFKERT